jgi:hypothetical protein
LTSCVLSGIFEASPGATQFRMEIYKKYKAFLMEEKNNNFSLLFGQKKSVSSSGS